MQSRSPLLEMWTGKRMSVYIDVLFKDVYFIVPTFYVRRP